MLCCAAVRWAAVGWLLPTLVPYCLPRRPDPGPGGCASVPHRPARRAGSEGAQAGGPLPCSCSAPGAGGWAEERKGATGLWGARQAAPRLKDWQDWRSRGGRQERVLYTADAQRHRHSPCAMHHGPCACQAALAVPEPPSPVLDPPAGAPTLSRVCGGAVRRACDLAARRGPHCVERPIAPGRAVLRAPAAAAAACDVMTCSTVRPSADYRAAARLAQAPATAPAWA